MASEHARKLREVAAQLSTERFQGWANPLVGTITDAADFLEGRTTIDTGEAVLSRPAPAATDTGLVTIGYVLQSFVDGEGADYNEIFRTVREPENWTATVTRSQAEELLAAERAEKEELRRAIMGKEPAPDLQHGNFLEMAATLHRACDGARKRAEYAEQRLGQSEAELKQVRADNAALTAKLETATALVTCCCGDPVDAHDMGSGHSPVDQYHYAMMQLEAKLTAAEKALEFYRDGFKYHPKRTSTGINLSEWKPTSALLEDCGEVARAVLGGKPS